MKIKRFTASSTRQAMDQVKAELGDDAVILSNKACDEGVELICAIDYDEQALFTEDRPLDERASSAPYAPASPGFGQSMALGRANGFDGNRRGDGAAEESQTVATMQAELSGIRGMLEQQISGLLWSDVARNRPEVATMIRRLVGMGFSADLARKVTADIEAVEDSEIQRSAMAALGDRLITRSLPQRGIVALVGPTGAGKTTTVAKLAGQVGREIGAASVALVSIDGNRIGAHAQLQHYGQIFGMAVRTAGSATELCSVLEELSDKALICIDTAGYSQHDVRLKRQISLLRGLSDWGIELFLALPATSQLSHLKAVVQQYQIGAQGGVIVTKCDEAERLGEVLGCVIEQALVLAATCDGQDIPRDLWPADATGLVSRLMGAVQGNAPLTSAGENNVMRDQQRVAVHGS